MSTSRLLLTVNGPWPVPCDKNKQGTKHIDGTHAAQFWQSYSSPKNDRGIYIFAIRNRGVLPAYVGKACKSFGQEVFSPDKINKYNAALHKWTHGTPILFLLKYPSNRWSNAKLLEIEKALIRDAYAVNDELLNSHHAGSGLDWGIRGVRNSPAGTPSSGAKALRKMLYGE